LVIRTDRPKASAAKQANSFLSLSALFIPTHTNTFGGGGDSKQRLSYADCENPPAALCLLSAIVIAKQMMLIANSSSQSLHVGKYHGGKSLFLLSARGQQQDLSISDEFDFHASQ